VDDVRSSGQIQARPSCAEGQDEKGRTVVALEMLDEGFALRHARATVQHHAAPAKDYGQVRRQRVDNLAELCKNEQIPPNLVVKWQAIDIADAIFSLIWRRHLVHTGGRNRKSCCEPLSPSAAHRFTT
jgi:hypothetical protein